MSGYLSRLLIKADPAAQDLVSFFVDDVSIKKMVDQAQGGSGVPSDGWYYIKNTNSGKYLQVADNKGGNSVNVVIGTGTASAGRQKWYITNLGKRVCDVEKRPGIYAGCRIRRQ